MRLFKYLTFLLLLTCINESFAQQVIDTVELKLGKDKKLFIDNVQLISSGKQQPVSLNNGSYKINNATQKARIVLRNKLINGTASIRPDAHTRNEYVILNSAIQSINSFTDDVLVLDIYRKDTEIHFREYYANQKVKTEGHMSLDQQKNYGKAIMKGYDKDGKLEKLANDITETYIDFYPNGQKRSVSGPDGLEGYDEKGVLSSKQYSKNNIHYIDHYDDGKVSLRSYEDADRSSIKEYYNNGLLQKKEVIRRVKEEMRLFTYDQAGKLISDEPYEPVSEIAPGSAN